MMGKMHISLGTAAGISAAVFLSTKDVSYAPIICFGCMFGSLFPDIDSPKSTISSCIPLIPSVINKIFGHRKFIHTPTFLLPLYLIALWYANDNPVIAIWAHGFIFGALIHLIQDSFTYGGIMWLYPFSRKKTSLTKNRSDSEFNWIVSIFLWFNITAVLILFRVYFH